MQIETSKPDSFIESILDELELAIEETMPSPEAEAERERLIDEAFKRMDRYSRSEIVLRCVLSLDVSVGLDEEGLDEHGQPWYESTLEDYKALGCRDDFLGDFAVLTDVRAEFADLEADVIDAVRGNQLSIEFKKEYENLTRRVRIERFFGAVDSFTGEIEELCAVCYFRDYPGVGEGHLGVLDAEDHRSRYVEDSVSRRYTAIEWDVKCAKEEAVGLLEQSSS